ncbi:3-beta hydroxysteroid dehydrogenase/isomerase [Pseudohyphozyma bogoriensis]|nr:3-beta hydroxysteroid dehydrogenase/isomerase [Pseudohyphozyma bogoriensis]
MSPSNANTLVLVTGATGYVGSEIALEFLRQGFAVRQAIRSQSQADAWNDKFPQYKDRTSFVFISSLEATGAFDEAVKGVTYVAHAASPATFTPEDNKRDILDPAIRGTLSILESAKKERSIKAVVITSSVVSYLDFNNLPGPGDTLTSASWNPMTYDEAAVLPKEKGAVVYSASKAVAEKSAWKFMETEKPNFTLTTVAPTWVLGHNNEPSLKSWKDLRSTYGMTTRAIVDVAEFPPASARVTSHYVNVRDVAKAHVGAVTNPVAAGKRYLLVAGRYSPEEAARIAAKAVPEQAHRFPHTNGSEHAPTFEVESTPAERDFGFKYISLDESVTEYAKQLFSLPVT